MLHCLRWQADTRYLRFEGLISRSRNIYLRFKGLP
ncbi:MAG: aldo/keto reductase, partial [Bifidobacterium bifidum]|nr:aldo/keto reductase [Bifidobacterium bifidum]